MDFSFDIRFLSKILNIVLGAALIVMSQRRGKTIKENVMMSLGGLITITMAFFAPDSIIPIIMGLAWMLHEYQRQEKINSPHLWAILATMGAALMYLAFSIPVGIAAAVSLLAGAFVLFLGLNKLPIH